MVLYLEMFHAFPDGFGPIQGYRKTNALHNQGKLLSPVTAGHIISPDALLQIASQSSKKDIPGFMPIAIIKPLKVIQIQHHYSHFSTFAVDPMNFPFYGFLQVTPVEQAGERVPDGHMTEGFPQLQIRQGQSNVFGKSNG